jgi:hypothetical protein
MLSVDGGDWQVIEPVGGYPYLIRSGSGHPFPGFYGYSGSHGWQQATFDLSNYTGLARLRFRFGSDQSVQQEGWYVDDIVVTHENPADIDVDIWAIEVSIMTDDSTTEPLTVSNVGEGTLSFTVWTSEDSSEARSWLMVEPTTGSLGADSSIELTVSLNASGLTPGTYYGTVNIDSNDPDEPRLVIPVILSVTEGLCGDANGDGVLTTGDGFLVLNYFGAGPQPSSCWAANVNGDGGLTTGDGFYLLNYFGAGPALNCAPCEFSRTGSHIERTPTRPPSEPTIRTNARNTDLN